MIKTIEGEGDPAVYAYISDMRFAFEPRVAPFNFEGAFIAAFSNREFAELVAKTLNSTGKGKGTSIGLYGAEDFDIPVTSKIEAEIEQSEALAAGLDCPEFRTSGVVAREIGYCLVELRQCADELWPIFVRRSQKKAEDPSKAETVSTLLCALKRHRLMFLYAATAEHPESCTGSSRTPPFVDQLDIPGWQAMIDDIDGEGEFLWRHADVLNSYAECAIRRYGPSHPVMKLGFGDERRDPAPFWSLNPGMVQCLEDSVDLLLASIRDVQPQIDNDTARILASVARPDGLSRWSEHIPIRWSFLGSLDSAIAAIQVCQLYLGTESNGLDARSNRSGSSRSDAAAILFFQMAQAYYAMLENVLSQRAHVLDARLNGQYLWLTKQMGELLDGEGALAGAGINFEPYLPDLLPSTVVYVDWLDMAQAAAESVLADIQRFVVHEGITDPAEGSDDCVFLELFRPSIEDCISLSDDYAKRMQAAWAERLYPSDMRSVDEHNASEREPECEPVAAPEESGDAESEPDGTRELWVDASSFQLHYRGQAYQFNDGISFKLLERLTRRIEHPVRVDALIEDVWERQEGGNANRKTVGTAICRLRSKLREMKVEGLKIDGSSIRGCYVVKMTPRSN